MGLYESEVAVNAALSVMLHPNRVFYGWWLAVASFGVLFYTAGVFFYGFAPFFSEIIDEFHWPAGVASIAFAFQRMEQGIFGPFVGYVVDRFGPRKSVISGMFVLGCGFIALSYVQELWQFFVAFAVMALGLAFGSFLTVNTAVNAWFIRRRGTAMAIVSYGAGVSALLVPLVVGLIAAFEWRDALLVLGVTTWMVGLPLGMLMRDAPEKYGLLPDGMTKEQAERFSEHDTDDRYADITFTVREATRTPTYWKYVVANLFGFIFFGAFIIHQYKVYQEFGFSNEWATALVTLLPLASFPGRILGGVLADKYDKRKIVSISFTMQIIGAVLFFFARDPLTAVLFAVFFGFGFGLGNPPRSALLGELFGRQVYGQLLGLQFTVTALGGVFAPIFAGLMFDGFGAGGFLGIMFDGFGAEGYRWAFLTLGLLSTISLYMYLTMKRPKLPERLAKTYVETASTEEST